MKRRLLFVCDDLVGGESIAVGRLITALKKDNSFVCESLTFPSRKPSKKRLSFVKNTLRYYLDARLKIYNKISKTYPDYILVSDYLWALAALSVHGRKFRVILSFHGIKSIKFHHFSYLDYRQVIIKFLERFAWIGANAITVPSTEGKKYLIKNLGFLVDKNKIFTVNNIIPGYFFIDHSNLSLNKFNILYSGRIGKNKGLENLIDAFSKFVKEGHIGDLTIAYPSSEINVDVFRYIKKQIRINSITRHVILRKNLSGLQLAGLYANTDILTLPSDIEFAPLSVLEAYAAETPAISTSVGNLASVVGNVDPHLILKNNSVTEIYTRLLDYSKYDLVKRRRLGKKARRIAAVFNEQNALYKFKRVLNYLEDNKSPENI